MSLIFRKPLRSLPLLLAASLYGAGALAQESTADNTTVIYPFEYFQGWAPVTAQDMLSRIPGQSGGGGGGGGPGGGGPGGGGGGGGRGLGGGGGDQILIDGKRVAGKNNGAGSQLSRISASNVKQIEIIRGTSGALDVRGSQIINIVLLEAPPTSTLSYEINSDRYSNGHLKPGGKLAYSGQRGDFEYLFSGEVEPRYDYSFSKETSVLGDWSLNDEIREDRARDQYSYMLTSNLSYVINEASSVRLNALYGIHDNDSDLTRSIKNLRVTPNTLQLEREETPTEQGNWELGGDYEYIFASGNRLRLIVIANEFDRDSARERYLVNSPGNEVKNLFLRSLSTNEERIVRGGYSMSLFDSQELEVGVERARTTLYSNLLLGSSSATGTPSPDFGGLVPVTVSNSNSKVEEIRYEPFMVHNWQISPRMTLESSLIYEMSEITQTGDLYNKRDFAFIKPKVDWRFNISQEMQVKAVVEKVVRQLSFGDFVASGNYRDLDADTEAGNANLKQEQVWRAELGGEYRLPNDQGVLDGNITWMKHIDVIERVDVSTSPTNIQSANGNIGDGTMYGIYLNASVRMGIINLPNLLLTSNLAVQDSELTDPFLGIDRRFANYERGRFQLGFRHDIPSLRLNYGMSWNNRFDGNMKRYDINNIERQTGDPYVSMFLQVVAFDGITFRFDARNITNNQFCRERQRFQGRISSGIITETEDMCTTSGSVMSLKVSGRF